MNKAKLILLLFVLIFFSCARIVMPTGGPADTTEPEVKNSQPLNYATNFSNDKIVIDFDEYIVLKNFNQEFVSSPLFKEKPTKKLVGKSLILKFDKDSLEENTTYTLDFGNSIVDFHAGNILKSYQYVFSTGEVIDSLSISGFLYMAEDRSPKEQVWIMLYKENNDTILESRKPDFIARTDENGYYEINNIAAGTYAIYALNDINKNYIFDLPNEQIAFLDSVFILKIDEQEHLDSLSKLSDSLLIETKDSMLVKSSNKQAEPDSINQHNNKIKTIPNQLDLYLFEESFSNLYISDFKRLNKYKLKLIFSEPFDSTLVFSFNKETKENWIIEPSVKRDTFDIWLVDTALANTDSLKIYLDYYKTDTSFNLVAAKDTLKCYYTKKVKTRTKKDKKQDLLDSTIVKKDYLKISGNITKKTLDVYKKPTIKVSFPLRRYNFDKIHFYEKIDTNFVEKEVRIIKDSLVNRSYIIDEDLIENKEYKVLIDANAFVDYRDWVNDTSEYIFKTTKLDSYTNIVLKVQAVDGQKIIQLFDASDKIVRESILLNDSTLNYSFLKPGNYSLKIIDDRNANGVWDTGNYSLKIQPEKVLFYPEEMPTKAGWTHEFIWNLIGKNN